MKTVSLLLLLGALAGETTSAWALCSVAGAGLSFGPYDPLSSAGAAVSGTLTVTCDQSPAPAVTVMIGPSAISGGFFPRRLRQTGASATLEYNLYIDPQGSLVWGDGTGGTGTRSDRVAKNKPWVVTIYGRLPGNQDVPAGIYSDNLAVTINF